MAEYLKPLPMINEETRAYWEGCKAEKLLLQKCRSCGTYQNFPRIVCSKCLADQLDWIQSTGRGKVYSYTIINRPSLPVFKADVPYTLAIIELEEGVRMMSNIIGCPPEDVAIGMQVEVMFDHVTPEVALPKFRPIRR